MTTAEAVRIFEGHAGHEGAPDPGSCLICRRQTEVFLRFGETLPDPQAPDPSWFEDVEGWVHAPLNARGTL